MPFSKLFAKNNAQGIVILDSSSSITFENGHTFPTDVTSGQYLITLGGPGGEIVKVTSASEDASGILTVNVTREQEGSTYSDATSGTIGYSYFTAGMMNGVYDMLEDLFDSPQIGSLDVTGNITVGGTVDGRNVSVDGTKLDTIASGAQVNTVASVNSKTGTVVLVTGDISDTTSTQKYATAAQLTKINYLDVTSSLNLNIMYDAIQLNNAKVTNANHTGDVTGSSGLVIVPSAISGKTEVTPATGDYVLLWDATDSALKKGLVNSLIGVGDVVGPSFSVDGIIPLYDSTTGKLLKNSALVVDASSNLSGVNNISLSGTLDGRDIAADGTKLDLIDVTSSLDLNAMYSDIQTNNAKVSNVTHTGEVTGSTALTIDPTAISGKTQVTPTTSDYLLLWDATDSALKKTSVADMLIAGGSSGDVIGPGGATNNAVVLFDSTTGKIVKNSSIIVDVSNNISGINNITLTGTVDGRDVAADGTKLDGIASGAQVNTVTSVNSKTGAVVLVTGDISDTTSTQKYVTAADVTKLGYISVTQAVDLDTMESNIATNNAKVTNANHTGDVTGSSALVIVPSAISGKTEVTAANGDYLLLWDATDSALKKTLVDTLIGGGSGGDVVGPASATNNAIPLYDSTTGKLIKNSSIIVDVSNNISGINNITLSGTVDGRDIAADGTKLDLIDVTSSINLNTLYSEVQVNNAKVTNATHTGEVTGSGALTISPTAISGKTQVTPASSDFLLLWDATDSALKKTSVADMLTAGGTGDVVGPEGAVDNAIALYDSTTGKIIKESVVTVDVSGNISGVNNITLSGTVDGRDIAADGTKLDGIASGAQVNTVNSVNSKTGTVVLVTGDISDTTSTQKYVTAADVTKLGYISVTQAVDLDTMESNIATNNAKVTNATHTGEVTGSTALTIDPTAISGKTQVTAANGDYLLLWDATDSSLKKTLVDDLIGGGSGGDVVGPSSSTDTAIAIFDSTTGKLLKNTSVLIDASFNISGLNNITLSGTVDGRDIAADGTKLDLIDVTSSVDLNSMYSDIQTNNAKVTNANHTGDVTGSSALTIVPAAISGKTEATAALGDYILVLDASDNLVKKALVDTFIGDGSGGGGDVFGPTGSTNTSIVIYDGTTGKAITNTTVLIDTSSNVSGVNNLNIDGYLNLTKSARYTLQHSLDNSGSVTWDIGENPVAIINNPTDDIILTINNIELNSEATLIFIQNSSNVYTITWPISVVWAEQIEPTFNELGSTYIISFYSYDGSGLICGYISDTSSYPFVSGPLTSTISAIPLYDSTSGNLLKNSSVLIDGSFNISGLNNITLTGTVDGRDIAADGTKLDLIDVTSSINLNTLYSEVQVNNAKVTNATHTGEVTGSTTLTISPTAISGKTEVTAATGDYLLLWDATDSSLKKTLVNSFIGTGDVVGPASSTDTAIAIFDSTTGKLLKNTGVTIDASNNMAGVGTFNSTGVATIQNVLQVGTSSTAAARYVDIFTDTSNRKGVRFYRGSNVKWVVQSDTDHSFKILRYDTTAGTFAAYDMIIDGVTGNISVSGTVDGRDLAADGTKLDGIASGAQVNTVNSVNSKTGSVVLVTGDISDTTSTQKYVTAADITKLGHISVTQAVDLDTMESNIATNNAKVTNATHTGEVTGSTALTISPTAISGKTEVTAANGDYVLIWDATDSSLKKALVNTFISNDAKLALIDVTSSVNLNTMYSDIQTNNAKVTNATHTGEVTGSTALTIDPTAISGKTEVTPAAGDYFLLWDATDSALKKGLVDTLIGGGSGGDVSGPASSTDNAIAIFDGTTGKIIQNSSITVDVTSLTVPGFLTVTGQARHSEQTTLSASGSVSWNINNNPKAKIAITGNVTSLTISGININSEATLYIKQDASTAYTVSWPGTVIWAGGVEPDLSALGSENIISFYSFDGTNLFASHISDSVASNYVQSVNGETGVVVLVSDDIDDTTSVNKFATAAQLAKVDYIDVTSAVDLNTMYSDTQTNNAKVTNANHTGDVTGADVLGIVPAAISGRSSVTAVSGDYVLLWDATDSALKKANVSDFISAVTASSTTTFTNKRITKRIATITDATGLDINCDNYDVGKVTLAGNRILNKPTGTPTDGQQLMYFFYQDATGSRTVGFNVEDLTGAGGFRFGTDITGITLSTAANKKDLLLITYLSDITGWAITAFTKGF